MCFIISQLNIEMVNKLLKPFGFAECTLHSHSHYCFISLIDLNCVTYVKFHMQTFAECILDEWQNTHLQGLCWVGLCFLLLTGNSVPYATMFVRKRILTINQKLIEFGNTKTVAISVSIQFFLTDFKRMSRVFFYKYSI